jgi:hypothetical protein
LEAACLGLATPLDDKHAPLLACRLLQLLPDKDKWLAVKTLKPSGIEGCLVRVEDCLVREWEHVGEVGVCDIVEHVRHGELAHKACFDFRSQQKQHTMPYESAHSANKQEGHPTSEFIGEVIGTSEREHSKAHTSNPVLNRF